MLKQQLKINFLQEEIYWVKMPAINKQIALLCVKKKGVYQLYTWELKCDILTQISFCMNGTKQGFISPDGAIIYYLKNDSGDEHCHYTQLRLQDQEETLLASTLPPFTNFLFPWSQNFSQSTDGHTLAYLANFDQTNHFILQNTNDHDHKILKSITYSVDGPIINYNGELIIYSECRRSGYALLAIKTKNSSTVAEIFQGSFLAPGPSHPGCTTFMCATQDGEWLSPFIWQPETQTSSSINRANIKGDFIVGHEI